MIEEIIKKEWESKSKNYFLYNLYKNIWQFLYLATDEKIYIYHDWSIYYLKLEHFKTSRIISKCSISKFNNLYDYLNGTKINNEESENLKNELEKLIFIFNNIVVFFGNDKGDNLDEKKFHALLPVVLKFPELEIIKGELKNLQDMAQYFGYEIKYNNNYGLELLDTNIGNILSNINSEKLVPISTKIKKCLINNNFESKETYMSKIAIEMAQYLDTHKEYINYFVNEKEIFNNKFYEKLQRENNGYFRHTLEDSGDKEKTKEWISFNENEKLEIVNQKLIIYSFILAIIENQFK